MVDILQFVRYTSAPDVGFWRELGRRKLHELGLDDSPISIWGRFELAAQGRASNLVFVEAAAFGDATPAGAAGAHVLRGTLVNTNTLEAFKLADKNALMSRAADELRAQLASPSPSSLSRLICLAYADLKSHEYYYWFGFPALKPPAPFTATAAAPLEEALAPLTIDALRAAHHAALAAAAATEPLLASFWVLRATPDADGGGGVEAGALGCWSAWCAAARASGAPPPMLAFADSTASGPHPGWPLRNLLAWARAQPGSPARLRVVCWREPARAGGGAAPSQSISLVVHLIPDDALPATAAAAAPDAAAASPAVGWELNLRGVPGARLVSLRAQLDPAAVADQSVDLNLTLMKWRLLPELQLGTLKELRCLLIGAGTLGCNVARALMGWGVRTITFVDGGAVSHSNPVRQSLFTFADCAASERRAKATAAAQALAAIFPGVRAVGRELLVPMPGHPIADSELADVRAAVEALEALVDGHDAVFLLTDTRESRWLPSLLCAARGKLAITAALGFDSYVVMRHGSGPSAAAASAAAELGGGEAQAEAEAEAATRLGCYFCNDIVAPVDSTRDRTLDQQCTVTRPGLSMIASALAVELLVSLAHHPLGHAAPADAAGGEASTPLGLLPHQLRGSLPSFRTELLRGQAFSCCVACSARAVGRYRADGFDFLLRAFREPGYLEEFSGLKALHAQAEAALEVWQGDDGSESDEF
jgi:ubiquitin-like modifier-activating enzyme ATG7